MDQNYIKLVPRHQKQRKKLDLVIPGLYISSFEASIQPKLLTDHRVAAVICCLTYKSFPKSAELENIDYYRVDVTDSSSEPISYHFQPVVQFIKSYINREKNVLVHCQAGVSRSATIVLAYLMIQYKQSLYKAFFLLRSKRAIIRPNLGFFDQLSELEIQLSGVCSVDTSKYSDFWHGDDVYSIPDLSID